MIPSFSTNFGSRKLIYALDMPSFQRDFASLKTLDHGTGPAITFTRASQATFFDADGVLQTASNDTPRFDHDPATGASRGLLIEEARTNSIRNSQAGGSTNGVIGSGGVMPTNWSITANANGITSEIIGTGTEDGLAYIDIKISGTPTSNGAVTIFPDAVTQIVAADGQTWSGSFYAKLTSGSLTNVTLTQFTTGRTAAGATVGTQFTSTAATPTSAALTTQRISAVNTFSDAGVERVTTSFDTAYTNGEPIDLTLRIATPQLEQGAFPTSYIPTTTAAATRDADSAVVTPISSFYNAAEGTIFCEGLVLFPRLFHFDDTTHSNRIRSEKSGIGTSFIGVPLFLVDGAATLNLGPALTEGEELRLAGAYKTDDLAASRNGASVVVVTDTSGSLPSGISHLRIGRSLSAFFCNGHIRKIAYWPKRLTNTLLEQITT